MTTYATLKADAASWLARNDLASSIPSFITLAEAQIRRDIRVRAQETNADILMNATARELTYLPPERFYDSSIYSSSGEPSAYTLEGDNIIFAPEPSATSTTNAKMLYVKAFDALSADTDTNWLLTNAYDVYLYGTLMHSAPFIGEDERLQVWAMGYNEAVRKVNRTDQLARFSGSALTITGTQTP
jgi:hypothetical protein